MSFIADLHIHSKYSRATSPQMTLENIHAGAQIKGISVVGTGDFTHPLWFAGIKKKLETAQAGLFNLKKKYRNEKDVFQSCRREVRFMLSAEISCIYSKNGRVRKIHALVLAPDIAAAEEINRQLRKIGNIHSDGRPILGLDAKKLLQICLNASPGVCFIPAHIWTPHFSVFGSNSGFDSLDECFEERTPQIFALETGLSSDPKMNWRISQLDAYTLVSHSDAHSPQKLGREADIFDGEISYPAMMHSLKTKEKFLGTLEFFPEEGKYHLDGHRPCAMRLTPAETKKYGYRCPKCSKKVTVGVMHRVEELADRPEGFIPPAAPPFSSIIPLKEILAEYAGVGAASKKVGFMYNQIISELGNELDLLLNVPLDHIQRIASRELADRIKRLRNKDVSVSPGYDGVFGTISVRG
ncbi:MAG: endonuclease Q family protein [bacterium]